MKEKDLKWEDLKRRIDNFDEDEKRKLNDIAAALLAEEIRKQIKDSNIDSE